MKPLATGGFLHVESCVFEENEADAGGGAFLWNAEGLFRDCVFRENVATDGAGVYSGQCATGSGVRFDRCLFFGNDYPSESVGGYGAGVYVSTDSEVGVESSLLAFRVRGEGLAIYFGEVAIAKTDIDLAGRLVAVLLDERVRPGERAVSWNGTAGGGEKAPPGIYVARPEIGERSETVRITLLRE